MLLLPVGCTEFYSILRRTSHKIPYGSQCLSSDWSGIVLLQICQDPKALNHARKDLSFSPSFKAIRNCGVKILQCMISVTVLFAYINIASLRKTDTGTSVRTYVLIFVHIQVSVCLEQEGWRTGTHNWHKRGADLPVFTLVVFSMAPTWLTLATLFWKASIDFAKLKASLQSVCYTACLNFLFWGPTFCKQLVMFYNISIQRTGQCFDMYNLSSFKGAIPSKQQLKSSHTLL